MEWERHAQAVRDGINLPSDVVAKLVEAAAASGVPLPFPKP
jgi:hypothetical protein